MNTITAKNNQDKDLKLICPFDLEKTKEWNYFNIEPHIEDKSVYKGDAVCFN